MPATKDLHSLNTFECNNKKSSVPELGSIMRFTSKHEFLRKSLRKQVQYDNSNSILDCTVFLRVLTNGPLLLQSQPTCLLDYDLTLTLSQAKENESLFFGVGFEIEVH